MSRHEFVNKLAIELGRLPKDEVEDIIAYYNEYFDDAGPENEEATIRELGSPVKIATQIKADYAVKQLDRMPKGASHQAGQNGQPGKTVYMDPPSKGMPVVLWVILGIFAAPVALPLAIAAGVIVLALFIALGAILFSLLLCVVILFGAGILSIVGGIAMLFVDFASAVLTIGVGLAIIGAMALLGIGIVAAGKVLFPWIARKINESRQRHAAKKEGKSKAKEEKAND